jgi:aryl carrier-like protein
LTVPAWADSTIVLAPLAPITADMVNSVHAHGKVEFSTLIPSVVVDLAKNEEYLNNLSRLNGLNYAGGPLPDSTGLKVKTRTKLMTNIGSTEYQAVPMWPSPWDYWPYFRFHHEAIGMEFQEREAGLYEMVFIRKPELDLIQSIFITFPELQEFHTKDLFSKHPSRPYCWKYVSRLDDIIVMSSGENLNPVSIESILTTSALIKGALIIGQGRRHPICLIEPQNHANLGHLLESIWPIVEKANVNEINHGKISKEWIFFTSSVKPLPRASKGTIQRAAANSTYAAEIDQFYKSLETLKLEADVKVDLTSIETAKRTLQDFLKGTIDVPNLGFQDDLIACGMDSMQVIRLMRAINSALPGKPIDVKQIYNNPTIEKLANSLLAKPKAVRIHDWETDEEAQKEAWLAMDRIYNEFIAEHGKGVTKRSEFLKSTNSGPVFQPDGGRVAWYVYFNDLSPI